MNTIERIEARSHRMADGETGHFVTDDEWAAIKAVVKRAGRIYAGLPANRERIGWTLLRRDLEILGDELTALRQSS